ncbi:MAG: L-threonylcarbamoyladenylate synthase, partial [Chthoniobacterales bacterium]
MTTRVIPALDAGEIHAAAEEATALLRVGGIVALPTETVYGLACDALDARAVAAVFAAKERPFFDPLIVHVEDSSWMGRLSTAQSAVADIAESLAAKFWPGPLTMVLPAREIVPDLVRSGLPTVALRCSGHAVMTAVIKFLGRPLAAPSANRFGRISPVAAVHVVEELGGRIPMILDGGPCRYGLESTIVAVGEDGLVLLRPGPVTREELQLVAPVLPAACAAGISAPGM